MMHEGHYYTKCHISSVSVVVMRTRRLSPRTAAPPRATRVCGQHKAGRDRQITACQAKVGVRAMYSGCLVKETQESIYYWTQGLQQNLFLPNVHRHFIHGHLCEILKSQHVIILIYCIYHLKRGNELSSLLFIIKEIRNMEASTLIYSGIFSLGIFECILN